MPKRVLNPMIIAVLMLVVFPVKAFSQGETQGDQQPDKTKETSSSPPRGTISLIGDYFSNPRNRIGFASGAFATYQSNVYATGLNQQTAFMAAFTQRFYVNFGRRKSKLHLDYSGGYQLYSSLHELDAFEQSANGTYSYKLSRKASLDISDNFSSSPNGYGGMFSSILTSPSIPAGSPPVSMGPITEVQLRRQRITQNNLAVDLDFSGKKNDFSIFGNYYLYRYETDNLQNTDVLSVGASYRRQFTKWLSFNTNYSRYVNNPDPRYQGANINRLQAGGLSFKLSGGWQAALGGGVELANIYGQNLWREDVEASLGWSSKAHSLSIRYSRGFSSTVGIPGVFQSDELRISLGSRLTNRWNLQLETLYMRGSDYYSQGIQTDGTLDYYYARGGLEYALFQGLIASGNFLYRNQLSSHVPGLPDALDSYMAWVGVQFVFPSGAR